MGVVFDEVVANVEAPQPPARDAGTQQENRSCESDEQNIIRIVETRQRREQRLMAD
jgi:hypothetical protein